MFLSTGRTNCTVNTFAKSSKQLFERFQSTHGSMSAASIVTPNADPGHCGVSERRMELWVLVLLPPDLRVYQAAMAL